MSTTSDQFERVSQGMLENPLRLEADSLSCWEKWTSNRLEMQVTIGPRSCLELLAQSTPIYKKENAFSKLGGGKCF